MEEIIVISLGGSLIVPEKIDTDFLRDFKSLIISHVKQNKKFVIITGGGKICWIITIRCEQRMSYHMKTR